MESFVASLYVLSEILVLFTATSTAYGTISCHRFGLMDYKTGVKLALPQIKLSHPQGY